MIYRHLLYNSEDAEPCKRILAVMSIVYRPIAFGGLESLVELTTQ